MPPYTLAQAAETTGKSRSTILRAIQSGRISAARDELTQGWLIEPAELHRLYPVASDEASDAPRTSNATREVELLREMLAHKDDVINDLRHRLDAEAEERRKLTAILTDQRPVPATKKRRWWVLRRRAAAEG